MMLRCAIVALCAGVILACSGTNGPTGAEESPMSKAMQVEERADGVTITLYDSDQLDSAYPVVAKYKSKPGIIELVFDGVAEVDPPVFAAPHGEEPVAHYVFRSIGAPVIFKDQTKVAGASIVLDNVILKGQTPHQLDASERIEFRNFALWANRGSKGGSSPHALRINSPGRDTPKPEVLFENGWFIDNTGPSSVVNTMDVSRAASAHIQFRNVAIWGSHMSGFLNAAKADNVTFDNTVLAPKPDTDKVAVYGNGYHPWSLNNSTWVILKPGALELLQKRDKPGDPPPLTFANSTVRVFEDDGYRHPRWVGASFATVNSGAYATWFNAKNVQMVEDAKNGKAPDVATLRAELAALD